MNPEALQAAYKLFSDTGYNGTEDDFNNLIKSNPEALKASFTQFTETGYNGTEDDFKELLGVSELEKTEVVAEDAAPVTAETPAVEDT